MGAGGGYLGLLRYQPQEKQKKRKKKNQTANANLGGEKKGKESPTRFISAELGEKFPKGQLGCCTRRRWRALVLAP